MLYPILLALVILLVIGGVAALVTQSKRRSQGGPDPGDTPPRTL